jgi:error-prone DNA polymerase
VLIDGPEDARRRLALWRLGVAVPAEPLADVGDQLALPLDTGAAPELNELTLWERMLADYGSTGVTLREHPLELMRPALGEGYRSSSDLDRTRDGARVRIAGLVVARQRPATAKGVTFMLLEDEHGTINLVIPPPVFDANRATVRGEALLAADGRLERREGVTNVVVDRVWRLERPDLPVADVKHIEPRRAWSTQEDADNLRAVAPVGHAFGRRGR